MKNELMSATIEAAGSNGAPAHRLSRLRHHLRLTVGATILATATLSVPALAQQSPEVAAEPGAIVVTAQKREELLSDVPISIAVFDKDALTTHNIRAIRDFAVLTPGLAINEGTNPAATGITIRGIGALGGIQNTFGYYIDGFEVSGIDPGTVSADMTDIAQVEVLRGPQGTMFGRNVVAGAVSLTSIAPNYTWSGNASAEMSSYGGREIRGAVNVPIVDGLAAMRLSGFYTHSDGYLRNLGSGTASNDFDRWGVRGALRLEPSDKLTIDAAVAYENYDQGLENTVSDGIVIGQIATLSGIINAGFGLVPAGSVPAGAGRYYPKQNREVSVSENEYFKRENILATLKWSYDLGGASIVSVSGYTRTKRRALADLDESNYDIIKDRNHVVREFYSSELRLQSNGDRDFDWIGGIYASRGVRDGGYDQTTGTDTETLTYIPGFLIGSPVGISLLPNNSRAIGESYRLTTRAYAAFFDADYQILPRVNLAAGIRYNRDELTYSVWNGVNLGTNALGLLTIVSMPDDSASTSSEKATWRASLRYSLDARSSVYGQISQGYRAGGVQLNNPGAPPSYAPESIINYEVGIKSSFLDNKLSMNLALFYMDWSDIQIGTVNRTNNLSYTDNAGGATAKGVELDARATPFDGFDLTLGAAYLDTNIDRFIDSTGLDRSGTVLPGTPKWRVSASAGYEAPWIGGWNGFVRGTYIYNSKQLEGLVDGDTTLQYIAGYQRVDARVGIKRSDIRVELYAENLLNSLYATGIGLSGFSFSGAQVNSPPRRFGLRASVQF